MDASDDTDGRPEHGDHDDGRDDERESALRAREDLVQTAEKVQADRRASTARLLAAAEHRDDVADARDTAATSRDATASLQSFLNDHEYAAALEARRSAAGDRIHSKTDRDSAADDRSALTETTPTGETDDPAVAPTADGAAG